MLKVHHLNNSRSQRILWLCEELNLEYEIVHWKRDPLLAPEGLKDIHPLGKAPLIEDNDQVLAESGAIIQYLIDSYGQTKLKPATSSPDYLRYLEWLHYVEGSAMGPSFFTLIKRFAGDENEALDALLSMLNGRHMDFIEAELSKHAYIAGELFTGADIQLCFYLEGRQASGSLEAYPTSTQYLAGLHARPAYQRALDKGGPYDLSVFRS